MSTYAISKDIQAAIQASLPAAVADELQDFIAQAKKDAVDLSVAMETLQNQKDIIKNIQDSNTQYVKLEQKYLSMLAREVEITKRENMLELTIAQAELVSANINTASIKELAGLVFRNPTLTTFENTMVPVNVNGYVQSHNQSTTKSTRIQD